MLEDVRSIEGLGDSFMDATLEARRKVPPSSEHEHGEHRVRGNEYPRRRTVVKHLMKPVLDEAAAIRRLASAGTHPATTNAAMPTCTTSTALASS